MKTYGNSSPLAACSVISVTASARRLPGCRRPGPARLPPGSAAAPLTVHVLVVGSLVAQLLHVLPALVALLGAVHAGGERSPSARAAGRAVSQQRRRPSGARWAASISATNCRSARAGASPRHTGGDPPSAPISSVPSARAASRPRTAADRQPRAQRSSSSSVFCPMPRAGTLTTRCEARRCRTGWRSGAGRPARP